MKCGCCVGQLWMRPSAFSSHASTPSHWLLLHVCRTDSNATVGRESALVPAQHRPTKTGLKAHSGEIKRVRHFLWPNSFQSLKSNHRSNTWRWNGLVFIRLNRFYWCFLCSLSHMHSKALLVQLNVTKCQGQCCCCFNGNFLLLLSNCSTLKKYLRQHTCDLF